MILAVVVSEERRDWSEEKHFLPHQTHNFLPERLRLREVIFVDQHQAGFQPVPPWRNKNEVSRVRSGQVWSGLVLPQDRLQVPERVGAALVDQVLLDDGVGWDPVGSVARREGTPLENHNKVGDMQISYKESFIIFQSQHYLDIK